MSQKHYKTYVAEGPEAMDLEDVKAALDWRDANRADAFALQRQHEARRREAEERETLRDVWISQGGDKATFDKEWPKMRQENESARLRELDQGAKAASLRATVRGF